MDDSDMQRCLSIIVYNISIATSRNQCLQYFGKPTKSGKVKRRIAISVLSIQIGPDVYKPLQYAELIPAYGVM